MYISGVNARMFPSLGGCIIVTGVNARATNTRVAREKDNTTRRFNTDNKNPNSNPARQFDVYMPKNKTAPPSVARCFSAG